MKARILMLGLGQPLPAHGGSQLRMLHLARQTAVRDDVTMAAIGEPPPHVDEPFSLEGVPWGRSRRSALLHSVTAPYLYHRLHSEELSRRTAAHGADLVQITSIFFRNAARRAGNAPVVLDAHNVEAEVVASQARTDSSALNRLRWRWEARTTDRFERDTAAEVDGILACSDVDAAHFERFCSRVRVVPNGVDLSATPFRTPVDEPTLAYLGSYGYRPNEVAALTLVDEVLPRVRAAVTDTHLRLIGADPTPAMERRAGAAVEVTGRVDDAVAELQRARVLVMPLKAGSGTRLKALEAMAAGTVVVSTSTGVAGLGVVDGEHVLLAETPGDLAAAVVRVLTDDDLAGHLARSARELVERRFDWSRCAAPMLELHDELLGR